LTLVRVDAEQATRSRAEVASSLLEKEKTMIELDKKEMSSRLKTDLSRREAAISNVRGLY